MFYFVKLNSYILSNLIFGIIFDKRVRRPRCIIDFFFFGWGGGWVLELQSARYKSLNLSLETLSILQRK